MRTRSYCQEMNPVRKYLKLTYEQKLILKTTIGLCFSGAMALGKFVLGVITDYNYCTVALYTMAILLAKFECVIGALKQNGSFEKRNAFVAAFLFVSSVIYTGFMCRLLFTGRQTESHGLVYAVSMAFISFAELGFAIYGLIRTKDKGHYYRNIKIVDFAIALIALLTTQMILLDFTGSAGADRYNSYVGIGIGVFIALCSVYVFFAPRISLTDREFNAFKLRFAELNELVDLGKSTFDLTLTKSVVYGSYVYVAKINGDEVEGVITHEKSLWKRLNVIFKIMCCILSEILIFLWLIGRFVFFLRTINIPGRLERIMHCNGFEKRVYPDESLE